MLKVAQNSDLGVVISLALVISAVGQADDTGLMSNCLYKLKHNLQLVLDYCLKYNVQLCPSKTKLLKISPGKTTTFVPYNPIQINGKTIDFVEEAEHVGMLRLTQGNVPNILARISPFKKALGSVITYGWLKVEDVTLQLPCEL